jgi:hypothetical protein
MGLTGLEPVTLRLSSACSNQLSFTAAPLKVRISIADFRIVFFDALCAQLLKSTIDNRQSKIAPKAFGAWRQGDYASASASENVPGLEIFTSTLSALEARGFEPLTSSLQSWRSTN